MTGGGSPATQAVEPTAPMASPQALARRFLPLALIIAAACAAALWLQRERRLELEAVRLEAVSALRAQEVGDWLQER